MMVPPRMGVTQQAQQPLCTAVRSIAKGLDSLTSAMLQYSSWWGTVPLPTARS